MNFPRLRRSKTFERVRENKFKNADPLLLRRSKTVPTFFTTTTPPEEAERYLNKRLTTPEGVDWLARTIRKYMAKTVRTAETEFDKQLTKKTHTHWFIAEDHLVG